MQKKVSFWQRLKNWFGRSNSKEAAFNPQEKEGVWYQNIQPGIVRVGIAATATDDIGNISFMDFSTSDTEVAQGDDLIELEGEKAVETLKIPVAGTIINRHDDLLKNPELVSQQRPQDNWLVEIKTA